MEPNRACRGRFWPLALFALSWAGGCAMFQDSQSNLREYTGTSSHANQPVKLSGGFGGLSSESQQIERNLGIK
jgi:hypothetical protein